MFLLTLVEVYSDVLNKVNMVIELVFVQGRNLNSEGVWLYFSV